MRLRGRKADCTECCKPVASYKCSTCYAKYCSVECCKTHKDKCSSNSRLKKVETEATDLHLGFKRRYDYAFPTEDTIPLSKLMELKDDERLQCLVGSSRLRALVSKLNEAPNPQRTFSNIMKDPEFRALSNVILQVTGVNEDYVLDD
ncbi:Zinc finger HIT domain-containing protein 3 [Orchesella cincta]|uniref:Zinc finger HIT domain-containing protein 3 n=1 Tax=Orchesella cincta TaxID=48709 RepID=A0A1D2NGK4_ORCCI|nr:Zinc finger HIT domain-containing protein 3 [Orchesella cincta]